MRRAAIEELTRIAKADPRVMLLTADLGFGVVDDFARELPDQFINVGVAEQAMIGVATGMAEAGLLPYCYSIATFAFLRPFEFIRNGPVAHRLPVRIIGVGAGADYSFDGMTHYALEDLALARSQPGLAVYAPATDDDTRTLVREAYLTPGPAYLRLSRAGSLLPSRDVRIEPPQELDVAVLALGSALDRAELLAKGIADRGHSVGVLNVLRFDEATSADIAAHLRLARVCLTVEEHYRVGGLGSSVAEVIAGMGLGVPLVMDGVTALPVGAVGSAGYVESKLHKSVDALVSEVTARLQPASMSDVLS